MASGWGGVFFGSFIAPFFEANPDGYGPDSIGSIPWNYSVNPNNSSNTTNNGTVTIEDVNSSSVTVSGVSSYFASGTEYTVNGDEIIITAQRTPIYATATVGEGSSNTGTNGSDIYGNGQYDDLYESTGSDTVTIDIGGLEADLETLGDSAKIVIKALELKIRAQLDSGIVPTAQRADLLKFAKGLGKLASYLGAGLTVAQAVNSPDADSIIGAIATLSGVGAAAVLTPAATTALSSALAGTAFAGVAAGALGTFGVGLAIGLAATAAVSLTLWSGVIAVEYLATAFTPEGVEGFYLEVTEGGIPGIGDAFDEDDGVVDSYEDFFDLLNGGRFNIPPIVLDLDGDGLEIIDMSESGVTLDLDGNGHFVNSAWFGASEGIVFLDLDGDGEFSHIQEIAFSGYGDATTDLEGLAELDANDDGIIDHNDQVYHDLQIWQDKNGNAEIDDGELSSLEDLGIASLSLSSDHVYQNITGSHVYGSAEFTYTNGETGTLYDVAIEGVAEGTTEVQEADYNILTLADGSRRFVADHEQGDIIITSTGETDDVYSFENLIGENTIQDDGGFDIINIGGNRSIDDFDVVMHDEDTIAIIDIENGGYLLVDSSIEVIMLNWGQAMIQTSDFIGA